MVQCGVECAAVVGASLCVWRWVGLNENGGKLEARAGDTSQRHTTIKMHRHVHMCMIHVQDKYMRVIVMIFKVVLACLAPAAPHAHVNTHIHTYTAKQPWRERRGGHISVAC